MTNMEMVVLVLQGMGRNMSSARFGNLLMLVLMVMVSMPFRDQGEKTNSGQLSKSTFANVSINYSMPIFNSTLLPEESS